jgi:hypothetical protein
LVGQGDQKGIGVYSQYLRSKVKEVVRELKFGNDS